MQNPQNKSNSREPISGKVEREREREGCFILPEAATWEEHLRVKTLNLGDFEQEEKEEEEDLGRKQVEGFIRVKVMEAEAIVGRDFAYQVSE